MSDLFTSHLLHWLLSSPPAEWIMQQAHELLIGALKQGPIPQHVAFVMDGNRRYAKNHKIESLEGHHLGFEALARILEVCYKCGVKVVTVYAFAIENFNRPKREVDGLMLLAKTKLSQLMQHGEVLDRYGARIKICGKREMIPDDVLDYVDKAVQATSNNTGAVLNICFPYASREEMTHAVRTTVQDYLSTPPPKQSTFSQTHPETITPETLTNHMYTAGDPPLDMFVRTSGVERLSDFMLWQCHQDTQMYFLKCMWPEFDLWHFLPVLVEWQWRQKQKDMDEKPQKGTKQR
ncbi:hypothetical protein VSDG_05814 [Cytospora chrysosperma]|uniref:Alkyl transferase n=1 Tax=Cytospora chrysosperma TaxID=252740 RepID=A0A423VVX3_CYTCH|nr:hypothetical protein VSDG_05814 [Valsa sordida]